MPIQPKERSGNTSLRARHHYKTRERYNTAFDPRKFNAWDDPQAFYAYTNLMKRLKGIGGYKETVKATKTEPPSADTRFMDFQFFAGWFYAHVDEEWLTVRPVVMPGLLASNFNGGNHIEEHTAVLVSHDAGIDCARLRQAWAKGSLKCVASAIRKLLSVNAICSHDDRDRVADYCATLDSRIKENQLNSPIAPQLDRHPNILTPPPFTGKTDSQLAKERIVKALEDQIPPEHLNLLRSGITPSDILSAFMPRDIQISDSERDHYLRLMSTWLLQSGTIWNSSFSLKGQIENAKSRNSPAEGLDI